MLGLHLEGKDQNAEMITIRLVYLHLFGLLKIVR
jgi:hypothetical protein